MTKIVLVASLCLAVSCIGPSARSQSNSPSWDTYSDTWVGVDALGRPLPTAAETGMPAPNKSVGIFYFLTFAANSGPIYDNSKILAAHPHAIRDIHDPAWGPLNSTHYWGEPLFGYYSSDDAWVIRKHAQMLANAGVDTVVFDNSNNVTYDKARDTLLYVWEDMRRHGLKTPQVVFHCPFGNAAGIGTNTLNSLYESVYASGRYSDLWFRWNGKPLIIADPSYAEAAVLSQPRSRQPSQLDTGSTLGQSFKAIRSFCAVGGSFPTWSTTGSKMTLSLYRNGPRGRLLASQNLTNVKDNATGLLTPSQPLPAGTYYLQISNPSGKIGWWSYGGYGSTGAYENGSPCAGNRTIEIRYADEAEVHELPSDRGGLSDADAAKRAQTLRDFFTFRSPIAPYNIQTPVPGSWAWLQIYPQAPQTDPYGKVEEVSVGVAQNYNATANRTAPMSFPGAFSRSYHDGRLDTSSHAVNHGYNAAEQWKQALKLDPPFVFVTGWNEWTAGFYDDWAGYHAPPAIFVDEFTEEFSRDIEPMLGGHGDDYYYQLVGDVRRYKGARTLPPVSRQPMKMDTTFQSWSRVTPQYRDAIGDTAHRNWPGAGTGTKYTNNTGRNDIIAAKVTYDNTYIYFYVGTRKKMTPHTDTDWMLLYINADGNYRTGWLGYDYVINRRVSDHTTSIEKNQSNVYKWRPVSQVRYVQSGHQLAIAIPRTELGLSHLPATIDFKWADHCYKTGDWTDFTLNGDAAPDDRFNYRAALK